jgi:Uma2 family endonuclease
MNASLRPPQPTRHGFTGADVMRMRKVGVFEDSAPFELIDGEIIDKASEGDAHVALSGALTLYLARSIPPDVGLIVGGTLKLSDKTWPEPDFYLHPRSIAPGHVRGPDLLLVIELSDSSLRYDLQRKADLYREHGVREYWVVDLNAEQVFVHRAAGAWPAQPVSFDTPVMAEHVPGLSVTLRDLVVR